MKTIKVEVTQIVEIEVDETSQIVKQYESIDELVSDLVSYNFNVLPVIGKGVNVNDIEVVRHSHFYV